MKKLQVHLKKNRPDSRRCSSVFSSRLPAQAEGIGRPVVFALSHIPRAAVVETEDLVGEVQALPEHGEALRDAIAGLRIDLQVGVEVVVSHRSLWTKVRGIFATSACGRCRGALLPLILIDTSAVVSGSETGRESAPVVARTEIPHRRRLPLQCRTVGSKWQCAGARTSLAEVCDDAETTQRAGQECEALGVGELYAIKLCVDPVRDVIKYVTRVLGVLRSLVVGVSKIVNGLAQLFVEEAALEQAVRLQVILVENIVVVGVLRLQVRVSDGKAKRVATVIQRHIRHHGVGDGTGYCACIDGANIGIRSNCVAQLNTRQGH